MIDQLKAVFDDKRGVSPVIGVILMVAITVILAAVIGTFVLNLGGDLQATPQAQLSTEDAGRTASAVEDTGPKDVFNINHRGGDTLASGDYKITVTNTSGASFTLYDGSPSAQTYDVDVDGGGSQETITLELDPGPGGFSVGDSTSVTINVGLNDGDSNSETLSYSGEWEVQIIHKPSDSILMDETVNVN